MSTCGCSLVLVRTGPRYRAADFVYSTTGGMLDRMKTMLLQHGYHFANPKTTVSDDKVRNIVTGAVESPKGIPDLMSSVKRAESIATHQGWFIARYCNGDDSFKAPWVY